MQPGSTAKVRDFRLPIAPEIVLQAHTLPSLLLENVKDAWLESTVLAPALKLMMTAKSVALIIILLLARKNALNARRATRVKGWRMEALPPRNSVEERAWRGSTAKRGVAVRTVLPASTVKLLRLSRRTVTDPALQGSTAWQDFKAALTALRESTVPMAPRLLLNVMGRAQPESTVSRGLRAATLAIPGVLGRKDKRTRRVKVPVPPGISGTAPPRRTTPARASVRKGSTVKQGLRAATIARRGNWAEGTRLGKTMNATGRVRPESTPQKVL